MDQSYGISISIDMLCDEGQKNKVFHFLPCLSLIFLYKIKQNEEPLLSLFELTSPAGDFEKGKIAIIYGADSVYIGFPGFSLRAGAEKGQEENLINLVNYVHGAGKKIYFALNIFAHNRHIEPFKKALKKIGELNPDGLILSDLGFLSLARESLPDMHLTVSTQANTTNYASMKFWEKMGINRVVLARELSIDEIKEIRSKTNLELEVFVHGAVCMAYSGRCMLSAFMTSPEINWTHEKFGSDKSRHANLGDCVQPCRFKYALVEENRKGLSFPIEEDESGTYVLSAQDMCLIEHIKELKDAGVNVLKIEGRMKSIYYVANVTRVYRKAMSLLAEGKTIGEEDIQELYKVSHRGYSTGFTFPKKDSLKPAYSGYINPYRFVALIEEVLENSIYRLKIYNGFDDSKTIEIIGPDMAKAVLEPGSYELLDRDKNKAHSVRHNFEGYLKTGIKFNKNDIIRMKFE